MENDTNLLFSINHDLKNGFENITPIGKLNYKCPCCGYYTFEHPLMGELDICRVCCWFDDIECSF